MKRFFYICLVLIAASLSVVSCTEEEIAPKTQTDAPGGTVIDPIDR